MRVDPIAIQHWKFPNYKKNPTLYFWPVINAFTSARVLDRVRSVPSTCTMARRIPARSHEWTRIRIRTEPRTLPPPLDQFIDDRWSPAQCSTGEQLVQMTIQSKDNHLRANTIHRSSIQIIKQSSLHRYSPAYFHTKSASRCKQPDPLHTNIDNPFDREKTRNPNQIK